jgi:hypothetical protein
MRIRNCILPKTAIDVQVCFWQSQHLAYAPSCSLPSKAHIIVLIDVLQMVVKVCGGATQPYADMQGVSSSRVVYQSVFERYIPFSARPARIFQFIF